MRQKVIVVTVIALLLTSLVITAGSITDTYTTGDTLTATKMNNIKAAVNDNDERTATNQEDISDLQATSSSTTGVFESEIKFQVPGLSAAPGDAIVSVWLSNQFQTTCDTYIAGNGVFWQVGTNQHIYPSLLTYTALTLTQLESFVTLNDQGQPEITITTTIATYSMNVDVSNSDYMDVTVTRSEADSLDTCDTRAVTVRGAMVTYPDGTRYFVSVKEMVVQQI